MSVSTWTWIMVGITFSIYFGIAIWARAGSTKEFYIANGMATAADWMSAASFISMAGIISFIGYDGSVYLMGWTGGYVLLALLLAPYLRKFGKFTVPDFISRNSLWSPYRNVRGTLFRLYWRNEGYYLYPSCSILCFDFCLYGSCLFYILTNDWEYYPTNRNGRNCFRWNISTRQT